LYATAQVTDNSSGQQYSLDSRNANAQGGPIEIIVATIRLHTLTFNNDHTLYRRGTGSTIPKPQWERPNIGSPDADIRWDPFCFTKNTPMSIDFATFSSGGVSMRYTLRMTLGSDLDNPPPGAWLFEQTNEPFGGSGTLTTTPLPDYIAWHGLNMRWSFDVQFSNGTWGHANTEEDEHPAGVVFVTLGPPINPMNPAWVEVLQHACAWAGTQSGVVPAASAIAQRIYNAPSFNYGPPLWIYAEDTTAPGGKYNTSFHLSEYLNDGAHALPGQCTDVSDWFQIVCTAVGIDMFVMVINNPDGTDPFVTNPLQLIGHTGYSATTWNFHQVGHAAVYDPTAAFEGSSGQVPVNVTFNPTYKAMLSSGYLYSYTIYRCDDID